MNQKCKISCKQIECCRILKPELHATKYQPRRKENGNLGDERPSEQLAVLFRHMSDMKKENPPDGVLLFV